MAAGLNHVVFSIVHMEINLFSVYICVYVSMCIYVYVSVYVLALASVTKTALVEARRGRKDGDPSNASFALLESSKTGFLA